MKDVIGYWAWALMNRGLAEGALRILAGVSVTACWVLLLAGTAGVWIVITALYGTVLITAWTTLAWPPRCGCGVRHWDADDGDDQGEGGFDPDQYGRAA